MGYADGHTVIRNVESPVRVNMSKTDSKLNTVEWSQIDWKKATRNVYKLQKRIYRASSKGDTKLVRKLQKTLMRSWSARIIAVRKVTQDNRGKKTAGVDGVKAINQKQRLAMAKKMDLREKPKPARRIEIPKADGKELRPLSIPAMKDRAKQCLAKLALEPEWEALFEPNSYGFRPGRSCHDAIGAIFTAISRQASYVLDADIAKCFDRINHKALMDKINTFPTLRRTIKSWLKAGIVLNNQYLPTTEGVPQGGVISPLLANIALHGMEEILTESAKTMDMQRKNGRQLGWQNKVNSLKIIRYADDFVIIHKDLNVIHQCKEIISKWLNDIGLELKEAKTKITHTLEEHEGNSPGFDFLGFNIRQYPSNHAGTDRGGNKRGYKTLIKPSKKKIKEHYNEIREVINSLKTAPQEKVINKLNPIIRGWSNYYSSVVSAEIFKKLDHLVWKRILRWGKRRHPKKPTKWVKEKYFRKIENRDWNFTTNNGMKLTRHGETPITRHAKVKGDKTPYDGDWQYWASRMGKHPGYPTRVTKLLKIQKGKCNQCGQYFKSDDIMEVDHITPRSKNGSHSYSNLQLLHGYCHDSKTKTDLNP